jgi:hypothetical protein
VFLGKKSFFFEFPRFFCCKNFQFYKYEKFSCESQRQPLKQSKQARKKKNMQSFPFSLCSRKSREKIGQD